MVDAPSRSKFQEELLVFCFPSVRDVSESTAEGMEKLLTIFHFLGVMSSIFLGEIYFSEGVHPQFWLSYR